MGWWLWGTRPTGFNTKPSAIYSRDECCKLAGRRRIVFEEFLCRFLKTDIECDRVILGIVLARHQRVRSRTISINVSGCPGAAVARALA